MPCATRGPAHKLCRSLPRSREDRGKGIHSHAPPPPLPYMPQRIAHRSLPISRTSRKREYIHERRHPYPCPCYIAHSRSRGTRKGIQLPRQMLPVSSEAEKASCRLSCCSSSDAVLVHEGDRRLQKAALDDVLALKEGRELALLLGAEAAAVLARRSARRNWR